MLNIDFSSLQTIDPRHGVSADELQAGAAHLPEDHAAFLSRNQRFFEALDDDNALHAIKWAAADIRRCADHVFVLGIGGSALGAKTIQQALTHPFANRLSAEQRNGPTVDILDNVDPSVLHALDDVADPQRRRMYVVISKSGMTPETMAQYFALEGEPPDRFVFVTDPKEGHLRALADRRGIPTLNYPEGVEGRFSVLTASGLLPAAIMGVDINELVMGAKEERENALSLDPERNRSHRLAVIQHLLATRQEAAKTMNVVMPYSGRLERFAAWFNQLQGESIGKRRNRAGQDVHVGITPIQALGSTDEHSLVQLFRGGPNDKLFLPIGVDNYQASLPIPRASYPEDDIPDLDYLRGVTFEDMMRVKTGALARSLAEEDRPVIPMTVDRVDARSLGALFALFEGSTAYLAERYGINGFDQPEVGRGKALTKEGLLALKQ